jgi:15-cis-phytoene synthase
MTQAPRNLDDTYRARAIPAGSARYWSWLFAASEARAPLLGIYALLAEWSALIDPATERSAAQIKLDWWLEEVRRLVDGVPIHPVGIYLASLPRAAAVNFAPLTSAIGAAVRELNGTPLERAVDLASHACALRANPLVVASRLSIDDGDDPALNECISALAIADYVSRSVRDYRREAHLGRVPFAVDELLAEGIENSDLTAATPPARLENYLRRLRERAMHAYATAAQVLPPTRRSQQRHLLVLAALGRKHLQKGAPSLEMRGLQDMLLAWRTARRANA